jgi:dTDP-4-dehydrorhamnose 3,5-epimerase
VGAMIQRTAKAAPKLTVLRRIPTLGGDVLHAMKASDPGFCGFGEAYFSTVNPGHVKGWKLHTKMTLNLVVPVGKVQISAVEQGDSAPQSFILSPESDATYARLTVPPGFWVAFGGLGNSVSVLLNVANIQHDPHEAKTEALDYLPWTWVKLA